MGAGRLVCFAVGDRAADLSRGLLVQVGWIVAVDLDIQQCDTYSSTLLWLFGLRRHFVGLLKVTLPPLSGSRGARARSSVGRSAGRVGG